MAHHDISAARSTTADFVDALMYGSSAAMLSTAVDEITPDITVERHCATVSIEDLHPRRISWTLPWSYNASICFILLAVKAGYI